MKHYRLLHLRVLNKNILYHSHKQDEQLNQSEEDVLDNVGADAPVFDDQVSAIDPVVQETADLKSAEGNSKVQNPAAVRKTIAQARLTSEEEPNISFGGRGASASNPASCLGGSTAFLACIFAEPRWNPASSGSLEGSNPPVC